MSNGLNTDIILNSPYYRFNLGSILFLGVISFTTNYLMIPTLGLTGAAVGSTLSILLFNALKGGFLWFKLRIQPFGKSTGKGLLLLLGIYGLGLLAKAMFPSSNTSVLLILWTVLWQSALMIVVFVVVLYQTRLSPEIHQGLEQARAYIKHLRRSNG